MTEEAEVEDDDVFQGVKGANIQVTTTYPMVSAWEFEFLKEEEVIRQRLDECSIYLLVQRPLTYFDKVEFREGRLFFEIADRANPPLQCRVDLVDLGFCAPGEVIDVETAWHTKETRQTQPLRDVAAIRLFRKDGTFILWWSPHKILYEMLVKGLKVATADGDPRSFLDFNVLYVGKAFDQKVWDRLTGHDKMQRIMTVQNPVGAAPAARAPFEVSLILLTVVGLAEMMEIPFMGFATPPGVKPILHNLDLADEEGLGRFATEQFVKLRDEAMTREVEAYLIHRFRPEYNAVKYNNYPDIKGGMRSKGYSWTELEIEDLPAKLATAHSTWDLIGEGQYEAVSDS